MVESGTKQRELEGGKDQRGYWQDHIERWRRSGQSKQSYCREQGLNPASFYRWWASGTVSGRRHRLLSRSNCRSVQGGMRLKSSWGTAWWSALRTKPTGDWAGNAEPVAEHPGLSGDRSGGYAALVRGGLSALVLDVWCEDPKPLT